jgi:hypothetical protein
LDFVLMPATRPKPRRDLRHGTKYRYETHGCRCRPCKDAHARHHKESRRRKMGITPADLERLLFEQDGKCAICGTHFPTEESVQLDHDHKTGRARGLLCSPCNVGLGAFRDNVEALRSAADYLEVSRWTSF